MFEPELTGNGRNLISKGLRSASRESEAEKFRSRVKRQIKRSYNKEIEKERVHARARVCGTYYYMAYMTLR